MLVWRDPHDDPLARIRAEYLEMPELRLTAKQACRLWGLDPTDCASLLNLLVGVRFLRRTHDGAYVRADAEDSLRRTG